MKGHYQRSKPKRPGGWKKPVLIVCVTIAVIIVAAVIGGVIYYNNLLNKVNHVDMEKIVYTEETTEAATEESTEETTEDTEATEEETTEETTEPHVASSADYVNFLVVGQASREGEEERFADSNMLLTLNTYEKTLTMTSILRDSYVQMATYTDSSGTKHTGGRIKLTTIYQLGYSYDGVAGSMALMDLTLYNNFGIEVDYNIEIDFDAFMELIDTLGGLDIELTQAEADYLNDLDDGVSHTMTEGVCHLDGSEALAYARMRHAEGDADSDIKRTSRQQNVVKLIVEKLKTKSLTELQALAEQAVGIITTNMTNEEITEYLLTVLPMLSELELTSGGTCPAQGEYWGEMVDIYGDGFEHSVLKFDSTQTKKTMRAITEGETG